MKQELFNYLEQFMIQSNWEYDNVQEQSRAIFTTICLMCNIDADTKECDDMLKSLYWRSALEELIEYEEFERFMLKLVV